MRTEYKIIKNINGRQSMNAAKDMQEICSPLKSSGIVYFSQVRVYNDQSFAALVNSEKWLEHSLPRFNKGEYVLLGHAEAKTHNDMSYFITENRENSSIPSQQVRIAREVFGYGCIISVIYRHHQYIDIYDFGGTANNPEIINFYINNLDYLQMFIKDFKNKGARLIKMVMEKTENKNEQRELILSDNKLSPAKQLATLSIRELECVKMVATGNTIKQAGQMLNLSPRTVETHLNNAKIKLQCYTTNQIINLFWACHHYYPCEMR